VPVLPLAFEQELVVIPGARKMWQTVCLFLLPLFCFQPFFFPEIKGEHLLFCL
jgi:hypothetical protein